MPIKYQNKYKIDSTRLKNWDYGNTGVYFITICTKHRYHFFGNIFNEKMYLNRIGNLAEKFWCEIPQHFPFVELGNYVIMPNHMHGIIIIKKNAPVETLQCNVSMVDENEQETLQCNVSMVDENEQETLQCNVSTDGKNENLSKISPKPGTISTIIRSYKSVVTKNARTIQVNFGWQPRFHDHICRNSKAFETIQNYIEKNPENWDKDKFYK